MKKVILYTYIFGTNNKSWRLGDPISESNRRKTVMLQKRNNYTIT